jgi:hypothetical protein
VNEIDKRLEIALRRRTCPSNGSQAAQRAGDPVSLFEQVVELLIAGGNRRRIVPDLREDRPSGLFQDPRAQSMARKPAAPLRATAAPMAWAIRRMALCRPWLASLLDW